MNSRARILRLYTVYTALDSLLVGRVLGVPATRAAAYLNLLVREGRTERRSRRCGRRPYIRTEYVLRSR